MFFTKKDRATLEMTFAFSRATVISCNAILTKIKTMPSRAELDQALQQNNKDVEDAIQRWQDQMKKAMDDNAKALSDLQAAHENEDDFSAELATLQETHSRIQTLASMPVAAIINPPGTSASTVAGAAGSTVGGAEAHDAAVAAGGKPIEGQGDHPGSIPTPQADASPEPDAEAEQPPKES